MQNKPRYFFQLLFALLIGSLAIAAELPWQKAAVEGQSFTMPKTGNVRYQYADKFVDKEFAAGLIVDCANPTFKMEAESKYPGSDGDIAYGFKKECFVVDPAYVAPAVPAVVVKQVVSCPVYGKDSVNSKLTLLVDNKDAGTIAWFAADPKKAGFILTWWCIGEYGLTSRELVGFRSDVPDDFLGTLEKYRAAKTDAEREKVINSNSKCPIGADLKSAACLQYASLSVLADRQASTTKPVQPEWKVRMNGTSPSRPVYPFANNVRSKIASTKERVKTGELCTCDAVAVNEGTSTYCSVEGRDNVQTPITTDKISKGMLALCGM